MNAEPGGQESREVEQFIDAVLQSGGSDSTSPFKRSRFDWAWLMFPIAGLLISRGLLRTVVGFGYALAPLMAVALVVLDWWSAWRGRRS